MPTGVSPQLDEQVRGLLERARGAEHPDIEFKLRLDLKSAEQKAEFAKDVALQANLPSGGNLLFGFDNEGVPIGLDEPIPKDDAARVIAGRLMFVPAGIEIATGTVAASRGRRVDIAWVRVPPNPYETPTSCMAADGSWRMPVRIDAVTKYLTPVEAISHYRSRQAGPTIVVKRPPAVPFGGEPDDIQETLESNLLPFTVLPELVWQAPTTAETEQEVRVLCDGELPPFRVRERQIQALRGADECNAAFAEAIRGRPTTVPMNRMLSQRDRRRVIIGLLNRELVQYACGIRVGPEATTPPADDSVTLEHDEQSGKVYFPPYRGQPWKLTWRSFQRQAPRTVVGRKMKPDGTVRHWFHFACRLGVEDLGSIFALLVEPTWLFTRDGSSVMRSYWVSRTATKKMSLEDNARILYNLHCWVQTLSDNPRAIKLPLSGRGAVISKATISVRTNAGILGDRVNVPEVEVDPDTDIPEPIPIEEEESEGDLEE